MDWVREHPLVTAGLALGVALSGFTFYRFDRWRRRLNLNLERHR